MSHIKLGTKNTLTAIKPNSFEHAIVSSLTFNLLTPIEVTQLEGLAYTFNTLKPLVDSAFHVTVIPYNKNGYNAYVWWFVTQLINTALQGVMPVEASTDSIIKLHHIARKLNAAMLPILNVPTDESLLPDGFMETIHAQIADEKKIIIYVSLGFSILGLALARLFELIFLSDSLTLATKYPVLMAVLGIVPLVIGGFLFMHKETKPSFNPDDPLIQTKYVINYILGKV